MKAMKTRTYSEMSTYDSFLERFQYLSLAASVGSTTFGFDRWINQKFYRSREWKSVRNHVITRDSGCDLGCEGYEIHQGLLIHHINPLSVVDITEAKDWILEPEYLITTTHDTHNAIHFGDERLLRRPFVERKQGDTQLW